MEEYIKVYESFKEKIIAKDKLGRVPMLKSKDDNTTSTQVECD